MKPKNRKSIFETRFSENEIWNRNAKWYGIKKTKTGLQNPNPYKIIWNKKSKIEFRNPIWKQKKFENEIWNFLNPEFENRFYKNEIPNRRSQKFKTRFQNSESVLEMMTRLQNAWKKNAKKIKSDIIKFEKSGY